MVSRTGSEFLVQSRVDADTKLEAEKILSGLGFTLSGAVRIFLVHVVRCNSMPFVVGDNEASRDKRKMMEGLLK